ncbi:MAG: UvrD-helicase domain-containing protein, partial [Sedimentisphaerales bacterium]|nr:UvrD-helicase domain-containing protein [Sedimentisphaerales bacterium]
RDNPETLLALNERYKYILVDEYQDTNTCQYQIARGLSLHHGNLFVSGDPDQSIYAWRGADIKNILAFEEDFPEARVIWLEENFRSVPEVLKLADEVIKHNKQRKAKVLFTSKPAGTLPKLHEYYNEYEEADGLADWIREVIAGGLTYRDIAVFYRINSMSRVLEQSLRHAQIPYQIVRGVEFFKRKEIKDILSYLQLLVNPADQVALQRVLNRPARGIGGTSEQRILEHAQAVGTDMWSVIRNIGQVDTINAGTKAKITRFADMLENLRGLLGTKTVAELIKLTYTATGLEEFYHAEEEKDAADNIAELVNSAIQFESEAQEEGYGLTEFLQQVALVGDADGYNSESGVVSLMSLHAAKGLEFPAVRIIGLEEGILPHSRTLESPAEIEEERR